MRDYTNFQIPPFPWILRFNFLFHGCARLLNKVSLLNVKSKYVQHLVGNVVLVISEFLVAVGSSWDIFIHSLCVCFEFTLSNTVAHSSQTSKSGAENLKSNLSDLILVKSRLNNSTWNAMAGIIRILQGITKTLKGKDDGKLVDVLLNSLSTSLLGAPWDLLNGIHENSNAEDGTCSGEDASLLMNVGKTDVKILFLGNLVQLLCSLVGLTGFPEARVCSHNNLSILHETRDLVPRLLRCCLAGERSSRYKRILPYFQHKFLMLMIRLSFHMQLGFRVHILWLQCLHEHYQDLLSRHMSQLESGVYDTLEGSPFLFSLYDQEEVHHLSSSHLQRQAVFLFLRCSLNLIGLRKSADLKCACTRPNPLFASDLNIVKECCAEKMGLLGFYGWLQGHVPADMFSEKEMYLEKCIKFASSFIRLYVHEDDMLFEVLLQMFSIPSWPERLFFKEGRVFQGAEDDILFHISNLFNPLLLFHIFLAELKYDHQLLLDYLISKDTGSKCAEYLLRCLRTVCDSWKLFVEYSNRERVVCQRILEKGCKRRRLFPEDSYEEQSATPLQNGLASSSEQHPEEEKPESELFGNKSLQLEDAKACLLSLKSALRKLHKRKLFPYNPEALIRRYAHLRSQCPVLHRSAQF